MAELWCCALQVCHALEDIGIDTPTQATVWRTMAGVLWLGNLDFEANGEDATNDSTKVRAAMAGVPEP